MYFFIFFSCHHLTLHSTTPAHSNRFSFRWNYEFIWFEILIRLRFDLILQKLLNPPVRVCLYVRLCKINRRITCANPYSNFCNPLGALILVNAILIGFRSLYLAIPHRLSVIYSIIGRPRCPGESIKFSMCFSCPFLFGICNKQIFSGCHFLFHSISCSPSDRCNIM